MKRILSSVLLCLLAVPAFGQTVSDDEKKEGFRPLFDGKTFEGWKTTPKTPSSWKIEDGMLLLTGGGSSLYTTDPFEDFVVRIQWRAKKKGYNSGFFIRGSNQIQMQEANVGMLLVGKKTKGALELHNPPGEWNDWEVTAIGNKLSLKVNGKTAWEVDDFKAKKGTLGLEAEGSAIDFRNLRIKVLRKE
jgi:hypothetical protein